MKEILPNIFAYSIPDDALECTCKLTDKNHALCPVCDKEEYKKSVEQRNDAIKNVDERTTNKELISFLISPKKPFKINIVRDLFNQYYQEEISLSRLNERLNEIVFYWKQPVHGCSREQMDEYGKKILKSISDTFLNPENLKKASLNVQVVIQAVGETILNFPLPEIEQPVNDGWVMYWEQRCKAAEKFIEESPCNPDIHDDQVQAYHEWQELVNRPEPPKQTV